MSSIEGNASTYVFIDMYKSKCVVVNRAMDDNRMQMGDVYAVQKER